MDLSKAKKILPKLLRTVMVLAVLVCLAFALISTSQLTRSIDDGNRKIVLNYGNQVAARIHDLFERVDVSLADLSAEIVSLEDENAQELWTHLSRYDEIWNMDACGLMYEDGTNCLSDGTEIVFQNEISLMDVLSFSQKLNVSRQIIDGRDMLVFAKPCVREIGGRATSGIFAAMEIDRLETYLGEYGYSSDSFLVITQSDGYNVWMQNGDVTKSSGNCFADLQRLSIDKKDSVLQMQTRMTVNMDGTISYARGDQNYYMAYVPLEVNYWFLLLGVRSDSIDLTELATQHFLISALLVVVILAMGAASIIYLVQRNRSISRYNQQLQVATALANEAALANQANKAKQDFLAKISHEIRTPLNGVMGMITLAKEEYPNRENCLEYLDKATVSANYLLGLLNDVLDMSQIESGKQTLLDETVDMKALLEEIRVILETSAGDKGLTFNLDHSSLEHRYFRGDHLRLKQIIMNLCTNAVKYTPSGGWVLLQVIESVDGEGKPQLVFRVQDNGEGIAQDKLETIFKPFEQVTARRQGGVGLGLSIVRNFVELMKGKITVESQVGVGSTFTVTLPLETVDKPQETKSEGRDGNLQGVNVLLAEDNELNAEIAQALLERRGAAVTLARDGHAAVDSFLSAAQGTYQVVLMDIQMPKLDGLEATRLIRASGHPDAAAIPILAMTANAFHEQKDEMVQSGMNDFLYKPIDIDVVCSTIRKWIREE